VAISLPPARPYFRRIRVEAGSRSARAVIEDTPHHFAVRIEHDGARVTGISANAIRPPWSTCGEAGGQLQRLVGMALTTRPLANNDHTPHWEQCTHQFDIAGLAVSQAARGAGRRDYVAHIRDHDGASLRATLSRDGQSVFDWKVRITDREFRVEAPEPVGERELKGLNAWAAANTDEETVEAVSVLGRAIYISGSRYKNLDDYRALVEMNSFKARPPCYSFDPKVVTIALRNKGSSRWFTDPPPARFANESADELDA
jgi:hypothetical protein